jgi:CBS domain-containing protein
MSKFLERRVGNYMTTDPVTVPATMSLRCLETLLEQRDYNILPVMDGSTLVGVVSKFDFLKAFALNTEHPCPHYDELMSKPVAEVMTPIVVTIKPTAPLTRALQAMVEQRVRSMVVVADDGALTGVISRGDIMRALRETSAKPNPTPPLKSAA